MNTRGKIHSLIPLRSQIRRGGRGVCEADGVVLFKRTGKFTVKLQSVLKNLSGSLLLSVFLIAVTPASVNSVQSLSVSNPYLTSSISGGLIRPLFILRFPCFSCAFFASRFSLSGEGYGVAGGWVSLSLICHSFMFLKGNVLCSAELISTMIIPSFISNILFLICVFDILYLILLC